MPIAHPEFRRRAALPVLAAASLLAASTGMANKTPVLDEFEAVGTNLRANGDNNTFSLDSIVLQQATTGTLIRAQKADVTGEDFNNARYELRGDVHFEYREKAIILDADSAIVVVAAGQLVSVDVLGNTRFSHQPQGATGANNGTAESIFYSTASGDVRFLPPASFTKGRTEYSSESPLVYNTNTSDLKSERAGNDDARIRLNMRPEDIRRVAPPRQPDRTQAQ